MNDGDDAADSDPVVVGDADDPNETDGGVPTWATLFARAATYEVDESAVRESLASRRERADG